MTAPTRYQFLIDGEVSDRVKAAFPELSVAPTAGGYTSLYGPVADHSAMRSIMARLDSLGLTVAELTGTPRLIDIHMTVAPTGGISRGHSF